MEYECGRSTKSEWVLWETETGVDVSKNCPSSSFNLQPAPRIFEDLAVAGSACIFWYVACDPIAPQQQMTLPTTKHVQQSATELQPPSWYGYNQCLRSEGPKERQWLGVLNDARLKCSEPTQQCLICSILTMVQKDLLWRQQRTTRRECMLSNHSHLCADYMDAADDVYEPCTCLGPVGTPRLNGVARCYA